jgi:hypothetical protein
MNPMIANANISIISITKYSLKHRTYSKRELTTR